MTARRRLVPDRNDITVALAAILLFGASGWLYRRARAQLDAASAETSTYRSLVARIDNGRREYQPPTAAESVSWDGAQSSMADDGIRHEDRLALLERISRAAEASGMRAVRVGFAKPDSTQPPDRTALGSPKLVVAPYVLVVNGVGAFASVVDLVRALPPSVSIESITVSRPVTGSTTPAVRIQLGVYEIEAG